MLLGFYYTPIKYLPAVGIMPPSSLEFQGYISEVTVKEFGGCEGNFSENPIVNLNRNH